jgi:hypothetical protein
MKKIIVGLLLCSFQPVHSQTKPTFYVMLDASATYPSNNGTLGAPEYTYVNPYIGKTFGKKGTLGVFVEGVIEPDVFSINPGLMIVSQKKNFYHEIGIGPGFEFSKSIGGENVTYINEYDYMENKAEEMRAKGKLILNVNVSYAPDAWGLWRMAYVMYYPFNKWLGIGFHTQSYAANGPRIQITLPGKTIKPSLWVAGWKDRISVGVSVMGQWVHK